MGHGSAQILRNYWPKLYLDNRVVKNYVKPAAQAIYPRDLESRQSARGSALPLLVDVHIEKFATPRELRILIR